MSPDKRILFVLSGRLLQAVGIALYLCGAGLCILAVLAGHKAPVAAAVGVVLGGVAAYGVLRAGHAVFLYGKRLVAKHRALGAGDLLARDARQPVLYLRSFVDDQLTSDTPTAYDFQGVHLPRLSTEEEHLAKAVGDIGPFVAIANPKEFLPRPGATKISADDDTWQATVTELMSRARLVIFRVGDGRNLWWEIGRALTLVGRERLLFLIPNDASVLRTFRERLQPLVSCEIPDLTDEMEKSTTVGAILYFGPEGAPRLSPLRSAEYRASNSQPLRPMLRIALRPVFEQLGLKWTPPPVPPQAIFLVLLCGWGLGVCLFWVVYLPPWEMFEVLEFEFWRIFLVAFYVFALILPLTVTALAFFSRARFLYRAVTQFKSQDAEAARKSA